MCRGLSLHLQTQAEKETNAIADDPLAALSFFARPCYAPSLSPQTVSLLVLCCSPSLSTNKNGTTTGKVTEVRPLVSISTSKEYEVHIFHRSISFSPSTLSVRLLSLSVSSEKQRDRESEKETESEEDIERAGALISIETHHQHKPLVSEMIVQPVASQSIVPCAPTISGLDAAQVPNNAVDVSTILSAIERLSDRFEVSYHAMCVDAIQVYITFSLHCFLQERFNKIEDVLSSQSFAIHALQRDVTEIRRQVLSPSARPTGPTSR